MFPCSLKPLGGPQENKVAMYSELELKREEKQLSLGYLKNTRTYFYPGVPVLCAVYTDNTASNYIQWTILRGSGWG